MLDYAVIHHRQRLAVIGAEQKHKAAIGTRLYTVFFFGPVAVLVLGPCHDVGFHANREDAVVVAFHRAPAVIAVLDCRGRRIHVAARTMGSRSLDKLPERPFQTRDCVLHGENLFDHIVMNKKHVFPLIRRFRGLPARAAQPIMSAYQGICRKRIPVAANSGGRKWHRMTDPTVTVTTGPHRQTS